MRSGAECNGAEQSYQNVFSCMANWPVRHPAGGEFPPLVAVIALASHRTLRNATSLPGGPNARREPAGARRFSAASCSDSYFSLQGQVLQAALLRPLWLAAASSAIGLSWAFARSGASSISLTASTASCGVLGYRFISLRRCFANMRPRAAMLGCRHRRSCFLLHFRVLVRPCWAVDICAGADREG